MEEKQTVNEAIAVGDLIKAYHAGYFVVTNVEPRDEYEPIIHYRKVLNSNGTWAKSVSKYSCSEFFCSKVTDALINAEYDSEIQAASLKLQNLREAFNSP